MRTPSSPPTNSNSPQQASILLNNNISTNVSSSNKKVTISSSAEPIAMNQSQVNLANPSESGKSGSSFSQSKITFRTCCGVIELTSMKLACLFGMLVTVIGLLVLAGVAVAAFITATSKSTEILISVGRVTSQFEGANAIIVRYVFAGTAETYSTTLATYKKSYLALQQNLTNILANLNDPQIETIFNSTAITAVNNVDSLNTMMMYMAGGVTNTQRSDAIEKLNSEVYKNYFTTFRSGLDELVTYVQEKEQVKDQNILAITLVQLIIIVLSLFVILPIIIFVFTYAINRDSLYLEKIRRANAVMLMDTIEDEGLRALFKVHCEKEKSSENFLLLEKIQYYRSLCERSIDLQMRLFGQDAAISDALSDISADSSHSSKKKKESPLEREYNELEAKKYEVAFEIFTEFLEVTGDMAVNVSKVLTDFVKDKLDKFNDKQIDTLPEDMFDILGKETCLVMMDTHHRFKQSLAFQREMKIDKIKVDQIKKKRNIEF
ncbi:RGS domain-containing protein [Naegleria gruberi]|uniref:RGS domain-containing protein n=1 Tax=Naegleria gruberi TaxID=5762 RepID=D2V3R8_NAEGR|nr:RGS domain-containing protein [Naegleria gruberi]EFC48684.1 RGS domain-containing protein [Naegleria gruberi]|eukprot:XP_002681428.1 RGS domain-containing protein [Naegleria gruberi strain NEG-M]